MTNIAKKYIYFFMLTLLFCSSQMKSQSAPELQYFPKVKLHIDLGQTAKAEALLKGSKPQDQNNYILHYYWGRVASLQFKNDQAISHFKKAIQLNPNDSKSFAAMALVKGRLGNFKEAIANLNQAIKINPAYAKAYSNRGVTRGAMKNNAAAIQDFSMAIRLNPRLVDAYRNRGITKEMMGDLAGACADWKIASALGQEGPKQWFASQCK